MASSRILKDVAAALAGSFTSRNNDIGGYWGVGLLCREAHEIGQLAMQLDLVASGSTGSQERLAVIRRYRAMLDHQLRVRSLPLTRISTAVIDLRFDISEHELGRYWGSSRGLPYACVVLIQDNEGREFRDGFLGRVAPHDPVRESRRVPPYDF